MIEAGPRASRIAAAGIALTGAATVVAVLLIWGARGFPPLPTSMARGVVGVSLGLVVALCYLGAGWLLASRMPRNPIGWLLLGIGLVYVSMAPTALLVDAAHRAFRPAPAPTVALAWLVSSFSAPALTGLGISAGLLFPNGHLLSPRWRWALAVTVAGAALLGIGAAINPAGLVWYPTLPNPYAAPASLGSPVSAAIVAGTLLTVAAAAAMVMSILARYRCGDATLRAQLRWILYAVAVQAALMVPFMLVRFVLPVGEALGELMLAAANGGLALLPIAAVVAISRYQLFGIDFIIGRTLVYVPLIAILAGLYRASISLFQFILAGITGERSDAALLIAIFLVAAAFNPVRQGLEGIVDRWAHADQAPPPRPGLHAAEPPPTDLAKTAADIVALRRLEERLMTPDAWTAADGAGVRLPIDAEGRIDCPAVGRPSFVGCLACPHLLAVTTAPPSVICTPPGWPPALAGASGPGRPRA